MLLVALLLGLLAGQASSLSYIKEEPLEGGWKLHSIHDIAVEDNVRKGEIPVAHHHIVRRPLDGQAFLETTTTALTSSFVAAAATMRPFESHCQSAPWALRPGGKPAPEAGQDAPSAQCEKFVAAGGAAAGKDARLFWTRDVPERLRDAAAARYFVRLVAGLVRYARSGAHQVSLLSAAPAARVLLKEGARADVADVTARLQQCAARGKSALMGSGACVLKELKSLCDAHNVWVDKCSSHTDPTLREQCKGGGDGGVYGPACEACRRKSPLLCQASYSRNRFRPNSCSCAQAGRETLVAADAASSGDSGSSTGLLPSLRELAMRQAADEWAGLCRDKHAFAERQKAELKAGGERQLWEPHRTERGLSMVRQLLQMSMNAYEPLFNAEQTAAKYAAEETLTCTVKAPGRGPPPVFAAVPSFVPPATEPQGWECDTVGRLKLQQCALATAEKATCKRELKDHEAAKSFKWPGQPCGADAECMSGRCEGALKKVLGGGRCAKSLPGHPCERDDQCAHQGWAVKCVDPRRPRGPDADAKDAGMPAAVGAGDSYCKLRKGVRAAPAGSTPNSVCCAQSGGIVAGTLTWKHKCREGSGGGSWKDEAEVARARCCEKVQKVCDTYLPGLQSVKVCCNRRRESTGLLARLGVHSNSKCKTPPCWFDAKELFEDRDLSTPAKPYIFDKELLVHKNKVVDEDTGALRDRPDSETGDLLRPWYGDRKWRADAPVTPGDCTAGGDFVTSNAPAAEEEAEKDKEARDKSSDGGDETSSTSSSTSSKKPYREGWIRCTTGCKLWAHCTEGEKKHRGECKSGVRMHVYHRPPPQGAAPGTPADVVVAFAGSSNTETWLLNHQEWGVDVSLRLLVLLNLSRLVLSLSLSLSLSLFLSACECW